MNAECGIRYATYMECEVPSKWADIECVPRLIVTYHFDGPRIDIICYCSTFAPPGTSSLQCVCCSSTLNPSKRDAFLTMTEWLACSASHTYIASLPHSRHTSLSLLLGCWVARENEKSLYRFSQENQISQTDNLNTKFENAVSFHWNDRSHQVKCACDHIQPHTYRWLNASSKLLKCNIDMANEAKYSHSCNMFLLPLLLLLLLFILRQPQLHFCLFFFTFYSAFICFWLGVVCTAACMQFQFEKYKDCHTRGEAVHIVSI